MLLFSSFLLVFFEMHLYCMCVSFYFKWKLLDNLSGFFSFYLFFWEKLRKNVCKFSLFLFHSISLFFKCLFYVALFHYFVLNLEEWTRLIVKLCHVQKGARVLLRNRRAGHRLGISPLISDKTGVFFVQLAMFFEFLKEFPE